MFGHPKAPEYVRQWAGWSGSYIHTVSGQMVGPISGNTVTLSTIGLQGGIMQGFSSVNVTGTTAPKKKRKRKNP